MLLVEFMIRFLMRSFSSKVFGTWCDFSFGFTVSYVVEIFISNNFIYCFFFILIASCVAMHLYFWPSCNVW